jgi:hypothetical protein
MTSQVLDQREEIFNLKTRCDNVLSGQGCRTVRGGDRWGSGGMMISRRKPKKREEIPPVCPS